MYPSKQNAIIFSRLTFGQILSFNSVSSMIINLSTFTNACVICGSTNLLKGFSWFVKIYKNVHFRRCICGETRQARIVCPLGENCTAGVGTLPWQAGLVFRGSWQPWCGASLISDSYLVNNIEQASLANLFRKRL